MVAAELVGAGNVNDRVPSAPEVGVLDDDEIAATGLTVGLPVVIVWWASFVLARVLLVGVWM